MTKKEISAIELKRPDFKTRIELIALSGKGLSNIEVAAEWFCQAMFGKFVDDLDEDEALEANKYSNSDIDSIAARAINEFGNPKQG